MLITISREFGAGGSLVAAHAARALGWRLVDNDFVAPGGGARRDPRGHGGDA